MRVRHKPLRRQPPATSDSPAPDQHRQCKAPPQPHRNRLQPNVQNVNTIMRKWTTNRDVRLFHRGWQLTGAHQIVVFGRTVQIDDAPWSATEMSGDSFVEYSFATKNKYSPSTCSGASRTTMAKRWRTMQQTPHESPCSQCSRQNWRAASTSSHDNNRPPHEAEEAWLSIDGSNARTEQGRSKSRHAPNCRPNVRILLARLTCSTTTPLGLPVDPEV